MNTFCPFFKETCKGNECVMFKNEECLIVSYCEQYISEGIPEEVSEEEGIERSGLIPHREEAEVPDWIKKRTPEELAIDILEFKKKEFPEDEEVHFHTVSNFFWKSKGIEAHGYLMPSEAQLKIDRAEFLAEREITRKEEAQKKKRLMEEKEEIPSLVSQVIDWARINGLKRLTLSDVDTYILEKDLDILYETKRALYAMANLKLKSRK
jgi:hypothetical protein